MCFGKHIYTKEIGQKKSKPINTLVELQVTKGRFLKQLEKTDCLTTIRITTYLAIATTEAEASVIADFKVSNIFRIVNKVIVYDKYEGELKRSSKKQKLKYF